MNAQRKPRPKTVELGTVYQTDGSIKQVVPSNGKKFSYDEQVKYVGGFIEQLISADRSVKLFADEEGACAHRNLPPNPFTWSLVHATVYVLHGYSRRTWRVSGPIFAIRKVLAESAAVLDEAKAVLTTYHEALGHTDATKPHNERAFYAPKDADHIGSPCKCGAIFAAHTDGVCPTGKEVTL